VPWTLIVALFVRKYFAMTMVTMTMGKMAVVLVVLPHHDE
jgi:hypothetical protein